MGKKRRLDGTQKYPYHLLNIVAIFAYNFLSFCWAFTCLLIVELVTGQTRYPFWQIDFLALTIWKRGSIILFGTINQADWLTKSHRHVQPFDHR